MSLNDRSPMRAVVVAFAGYLIGKAALALIDAGTRISHNAEVAEWRSTMDAARWRFNPAEKD